ncbi:hypothetical protein BK121_04470 [Paenibacillus odorifer]|nr:hypothetical protein BK121_04470 [Paenibacillus odorifer]
MQGSYANNTNVRTQSDVDIAVVEEDTFRTQYRSGVSDSNYGFVNAPSRSKTFKDEIEEALKDKFGTDVSRENKSIKIYGNTYRKDAEYLFFHLYSLDTEPILIFSSSVNESIYI